MQQMPLWCLSSCPGWTIVTALDGGLPATQLNHLQKIHNAAAHTVTRTVSGTHHPCPAVIALAPCHQTFEYKIPCLTYQCMHKTAPQHIQELVSPNPSCSLHSSSLCRLRVSGFSKNTNKKHSEARPFRNATPTLWNRLPDKLHQAKDIAPFSWQLKSHLFSAL